MPRIDEDVILGIEHDIDIHPSVLSFNITLHDLNVKLKRPRPTRVPTTSRVRRRNVPRSGLRATTRNNNNNTVSTENHNGVSLAKARVIQNIGVGVTRGTVLSNPGSGRSTNMVFDTGQLAGPRRPENRHGGQSNMQTAPLVLEASHQGQETQQSLTHLGTASGGSLAKDKHHGSRKDQPNDLGSCMKCTVRQAAVQCCCKMVTICKRCSETCRQCGITVSRETAK